MREICMSQRHSDTDLHNTECNKASLESCVRVPPWQNQNLSVSIWLRDSCWCIISSLAKMRKTQEINIYFTKTVHTLLSGKYLKDYSCFSVN